MKVTAPIHIGGRVYQLEVEGETMADIVRQIGPWQDIEQYAKTDCVFSYRKSPNGKYEFYALYSGADNTEMPLGVRLEPKGQLFAGKIVEEGKKKRLVRKWQSVQYGEQIEGEAGHEGDTNGQGHANGNGRGNSGKLLEMPSSGPIQPTPTRQPEPTTNAPKIDDTEDKQAAVFVAMNMVQTVEQDQSGRATRWAVGQPGTPQGVNQVWIDSQGRPQCQCVELTKRRKETPGYRCAHILAAKLFKDQHEAAAIKAARK